MTRPLDIWLVTIGEPLPLERNSRPLRTRLLAREFAGRGHEVRWWTSDYNHFSKQYHTVKDTHIWSDEGYTLSFLHGRAYQRNLSFDRQMNHIEIARHFKKLAAELPVPDVIVCSFPSIELAFEVSRYARAQGVRFIIDVRDLWPDEITNRFPRVLRGLGQLLTLPLARIVRKTLVHADVIFAVSRQYLDWALRHANRDRTENDEIIMLGYPDHPEAMAMRAARSDNVSTAGCTFFFSGSFNQSVDLGSFILAFRQLADPGLRAVLCGDGENLQRWRDMASTDSRIQFPGWCNSDQIRHFARDAEVGLVCYRATSLVAMPNKIFEYMSFGLSVINSIPGEAAALVDAHGIGLNYAAGDVQSLAAALRHFAQSADARRVCSVAAAALYEERFMSSRATARYADRVEVLAGKTKTASPF